MNDEYENENIPLEHFRLKSLRRKRRLQRLDSDKKLIRLYREERAISKEIWNLGYEELNPPVQRGWKRHFVLRGDVSRSKDARFFQGILDKINTVHYSSKKDFKVKKKRRGKKIYVTSEQKLASLSEHCVKRKKFSMEELQYFSLVRVPGRKHVDLWHYVFQEPWRFQLKIEPNIIRWTKKKDFDLERRAKEIERYFDRNNLRPRLFKIVDGRHKWRYYQDELPKYRYDPFKNRTFAAILDEYMPDKTTPVVKFKPSDSGVYFFVVMVKMKLLESGITDLILIISGERNSVLFPILIIEFVHVGLIQFVCGKFLTVSSHL